MRRMIIVALMAVGPLLTVDASPASAWGRYGYGGCGCYAPPAYGYYYQPSYFYRPYYAPRFAYSGPYSPILRGWGPWGWRPWGWRGWGWRHGWRRW